MREVAERLVFDLAVIAIAATQQMGGVFAALVGPPCGDDVNCSPSLCHARINAVICNLCQPILVTTNCISANYNFYYAQAHNLRFKAPSQRGNFRLTRAVHSSMPPMYGSSGATLGR